MTVRYAPQDLPSRRLHQQNAVIFADSAEILESTLWLIPAVPTAEIPGNPRQGIPVHILQSEMFGTGSEGGYGRLDFWDREPESRRTSNPHHPPPKEQETPEDPTTPQAMAEMLLELAERASETLYEETAPPPPSSWTSSPPPQQSSARASTRPATIAHGTTAPASTRTCRFEQRGSATIP